MGWIAFAFVFAVGIAITDMAGFRASMRMMHMLVYTKREPLLGVYVLLAIAFFLKDLLAAPLASLARDPAGGELSAAFPWADGFTAALPELGRFALDGVLLSIVVARPVLGFLKCQVLDRATEIFDPGWLFTTALLSVGGVWWHTKLTSDSMVATITLVVLSIVMLWFVVDNGLRSCVQIWVRKYAERVAARDRLRLPDSVESKRPRSRLLRWLTPALLGFSTVAAVWIAVAADAAAQITGSVAPIIMFMVIAALADQTRSWLQERTYAVAPGARR